MLKHIVLFKLKNGLDPHTPCMMKDALEGLIGKIPEIRKMEVGIDMTASPVSYQVALYTEFDDKESLLSYQRHPEHLKVAEFVIGQSEQRAVVDYMA
ncbi:MAG: Stress responsive A/B Barrel Domain protein [Methanosaeta sp. PtaB.Bin039]|nr:MAG: Stress responsive A/B Barrel Domain protein [Methanosaeta sp. PtaB.Bin039]OPY47564.1 MAG: Stress responsive A/B Barrel Domain protein [Methanosaeta sp. PtaU1.Bin028]HOT06913.1 Dabb family protein [Methanotrichaceae archaeon]HQF16465.1 Dabb family protein [Methanotrichaceae archaeon]HQI91888.1 Dabb family protein [Methanotrichaceae archaeon]